MNLLGRLNWDAIQSGWVIAGGQATMVFAGLVFIGLMTYKKRWKWLWREWLTSVDPKRIGVMYIVFALLMLLRGGVDAAMMRAQQAVSTGSNNGFLDPDHYQQIFTAHGTIMIFFVAMGLMFGLINLLVPMQIGARDVAFPFLNATSFWLYAMGGMLLNLSLLIGGFAATGWLAYPPLSETAYSPGPGVDYWIWGLQVAGIGSLLSGINFLVTILRMRAPGMTLMKMPMFCWSVLGSMTLVIFAFPILTVTLTLLALDRTLGMHFFTSDFGGNPMMYVNLIWAWGHPEVYILILPAFGIFSEIVATYSKKPLFGYVSMVWAIWAIVFLSFIVWLHHFFTMGASPNVNAFFGIMTMAIAVPTGVKIFNWLFTMYRGRVSFKSPMLWFMGFVATFTLGGVAGVILAIPAADFQLHNSLFLVAHFHTMIIGGVVFGYFAGLTYWFPKFFGFKLNERLGRYAFYSWLIGFLLAFIPLYILGLMGATRRLDNYDASLGWQPLFIVAAAGVGLIMIGIGLQILQLIISIRQRRQNIDTTGDPWNGRTLEWSSSSPPPAYNFANIPVIQERDAFWVIKKKKDHEPETYHSITMPANTSMPLLIAGLAFLFGFGMIWHMFWLAIFSAIAIIACLIIRSTAAEHEYVLSAAKVRKNEEALKAGTA